MMLSILIPTIPQRNEMFTELYNEIMAQKAMVNSIHPSLGDIEVIVDSRGRFLETGISIGEKRESLVRLAQGKYSAFCDDDESVAPNYVESLLRLCNQNPDVCTFRAIVKVVDYWGIVDMRLAYKVNDQMSPEYTIRRPPWHMCPVKTMYAKIPNFQYINDAEDFEWMSKVLTMCTTEAHTDKIIFQYRHGSHSESDKIMKHV